MTLLPGGLIVVVKIREIKLKYFKIMKNIYINMFNKQGFLKTRFLVRKRKLLYTNRKIAKRGLLFSMHRGGYPQLKKYIFYE